jgi:hypothetical protein
MPINQALAAEWTKAGYEPGMASAWVRPPPPANLLRVYHLTSADFSISDISFGRLKVSRFSDSNDPYELMALAFDSSKNRAAVTKFKSDYDRDTGLLCFSADWASPVLWSHYGARHRGICLGFNVTKSEALKVQYADRRLRDRVQNIDDQSNIDSALRELLICTKFRDWGYEREIRIEIPLSEAIREGNNYFWQFDEKVQLAEVILGPLCEVSLDATRKLVKSLYPNAITFQARLAIHSFSIVPKEKTVP